jgi:hypothetical protein
LAGRATALCSDSAVNPSPSSSTVVCGLTRSHPKLIILSACVCSVQLFPLAFANHLLVAQGVAPSPMLSGRLQLLHLALRVRLAALAVQVTGVTVPMEALDPAIMMSLGSAHRLRAAVNSLSTRVLPPPPRPGLRKLRLRSRWCTPLALPGHHVLQNLTRSHPRPRLQYQWPGQSHSTTVAFSLCP